ncbi:dihydroneopterin aldolase [bacterium SCSIO 12643]|nr:dihydroneopterin aldolase [bacterium SCSIO 12643]
MGVVEVKGISVRAFHGCIDEEALVGGDFSIDVRVHAPFTEAATTDDLNKAIDYVVITDLVKKEMAIRSKLIETVALRIIRSIQSFYNFADEIEVTVIKHRAPIESDVKSVSVYLNSKEID